MVVFGAQTTRYHNPACMPNRVVGAHRRVCAPMCPNPQRHLKTTMGHHYMRSKIAVTVNRVTEHGGASRHGQRIARWHKEHGDQPRSPTTQSGEAASEASENGRRLPCNPITRSVRRRPADTHAYTHPHTQVGEEKSKHSVT